MNKSFLMLVFAFFFISSVSALTDITNCTELQGMSVAGDYRLMNNIDCSDTINWNGGEGFDPIQSFGGIFDGNGYNISNLYINRPTKNLVGLFKNSAGEPLIKNLGIKNGTMSGKSVGGLVGDMEGGNISNSFFEGMIYCYDGNCGGLVGYALYIIINNSYSNVTIIGVGNPVYVGGLVGSLGEGNIYNSYSLSEIKGSLGYDVGGLVGYNWGYIYNSYAIGTIEGTDYIGGFVGANDDGLIVNSYSISNVTGNSNIAGFVGENFGTSNITNSFSNSNVIGTSNIGGFAGLNYESATCTNSYWNTDNGILTSACATGKTTQQLATENTFENWDFTNIWHYQSNCLPALLGQPFLYCLSPEEIIVPSTDKGIIYAIMNSAGAGIGLFFLYLAGSLPFLIIGILIAVMVAVIGSSFIGIFKGAKAR